jgi:ribonuclease T2
MLRAALLFFAAVGLARADALRFDHYLLALSLAPAFCEDRPEIKQRLGQCRILTTRPAPTLSLHGLWPNNARGRHPEYCDGKLRGRFCALDGVRLPAGLRARLAYAMPGEADCLDRHEWEKHGSCSGLPEAAYFEWSIRLAARVERALGATLKRHQGREVALATLMAALTRADPALAAATSFDCRIPRTADRAKRRAMLTGVRVRFEVVARGVPGRPLPLADAGRMNSGCPGGRAWVDAPDD